MDALWIIIIVVVASLIRMSVAARRGPKDGCVVVAIRIRSGEIQGLTSKWCHVKATVASGRLEIRPVRPGLGIKGKQGPPVPILILGFVGAFRTVGLSHVWSVNPMFKMAEVSTPTGVVELATSSKSLNYIASRIGLAT